MNEDIKYQGRSKFTLDECQVKGKGKLEVNGTFFMKGKVEIKDQISLKIQVNPSLLISELFLNTTGSFEIVSDTPKDITFGGSFSVFNGSASFVNVSVVILNDFFCNSSSFRFSLSPSFNSRFYVSNNLTLDQCLFIINNSLSDWPSSIVFFEYSQVNFFFLFILIFFFKNKQNYAFNLIYI